MKSIDLRSDTVTKPSSEMRKIIAKAEVGDDVFEDDPTVQRLENKVAELMGKEAAIFAASGTQTNLMAILTNTRPGDEVLVDTKAHIFNFEVGGSARFGGVHLHGIETLKGIFSAEEVEKRIRGKNIHHPNTALVCIENTQNLGGGAIYPLNFMQEIYQLAQKYHLKVHLDGARIFNAVMATDIDVKKYADTCDSITFCLSKGLGCPIGSILAGTQEFILEARRNRKALGGGMRQIGMMAAAGIYALENNIHRLKDDHRRAKALESILTKNGYNVIPVETNIVVFTPKGNQQTMLTELKEHGIIAVPFGEGNIRFVTHLEISDDDILEVEEILHKI